MTLTRTGAVLDYQTIFDKVGHDGIRKIKKIFSIVTIGHNNTRKTICSVKIISTPSQPHELYGKNIIKLVLPRFGGFMLKKIGLIDDITNMLPLGVDTAIPSTNMVLTDNQVCVLDHLMSNIYNPDNIAIGTSSTILQMEPGYGKTYLSLGVINRIKKKTFIIVPNSYLLRQWIEILTTAFPDNIIGCYYGLKKIDGDIIVSIINSALKYPGYKKIGLVIYDEVHMYCSNKFSDIFTRAQAACCLGITATPFNRIDKFDPVAHWALGKVIHADSIENWNVENINFLTDVTRVMYSGPDEYTKIIESAAGIVSVPLMINQIQDDPFRNNLIIAYAAELYRIGRNVFIFSDRREHLHQLAKKLDEKKIVFAAPELVTGVRELMGGSTDADIENAKRDGRIIMTTFQYSGTGVSINKMDALILATPRKSNMKQILGRIYRLKSDQTIRRRIIDIVDIKICLKSQYYTRKKSYTDNLQAVIKDHKIKWQECANADAIVVV